jgi:hypothetical protein
MFKYNKHEEECDNFSDEEILLSGNTIKIKFQEEIIKNKRYYYGIYLVITHKSKSEHQTVLKSTGKDGLLGLMWAKKKVKEFEDFIVDYRSNFEKIVIYCYWDDNRRRNVYEYGLKSLGYRFDRLWNQKALMKVIKVNK